MTAQDGSEHRETLSKCSGVQESLENEEFLDQGGYYNLETGKRWRSHFKEPEGGPLAMKPVKISANWWG